VQFRLPQHPLNLLASVGWTHHDAIDFATSVEQATKCSFLKPGDVLVLNNAQIHSDSENEVLETFLWNQCGIHLLWLPAHSPEMNPMELLWNILVQCLPTVYHFSQAPVGHRVACHAFDILRAITTDEVVSCYRECGYNV